MTVPFSMEQHLDSLVAYLRTNLPAYMATEDSRHSDGLSLGTLPAGNVIPGGMWPIPSLTPETPAIEVALPDQTLDNFGLGTIDADETLVIAVRLWQQHYGDPAVAIEQLYRKSLRLGNAFLLCVVPTSHDAFGNGSVIRQARSSYRVDPTTDQRESYTSSLVTVIQLLDDAIFQ